MLVICFELERIHFPEQELNMTLRDVEERCAILEAEREKRWQGGRGSTVKAWAEFAQRNHTDYSYPANFAEVIADTLEIRLFMMRQHRRILEAGLVPTSDDNVQIGVEWQRGRGFVIKGGFLDSLSKSISVRRDYRELRVPNDAEISIAMVRPLDAVKAWKAKRAGDNAGPARLKPEDGGWRKTVPRIKLSPDEQADKVEQQVTSELIYMQRREALHMPPDPGSGIRMGELLREQFEAERYRMPDAARLREVWEDLEFFEKRQAAMKELGLVMPPRPEVRHRSTQMYRNPGDDT